MVLTTCEKNAIPVWEGKSTPDPEASFLLDVDGCIARATWANLHKFINVAMGKEVQTTDVTEAINIAKKLAHALLRVSDEEAYRMADRRVLSYWPAKAKRNVKDDEIKQDTTGEEKMQTQTETGTKKGFGGAKKSAPPPKVTKKAAKPVKAEKSAKAAKPAKEKAERASRGRWQPTDKITVLSKENPKKVGTGAHERFELYKKHNTVEKYLEAGGTRADLNWDSKQKFIKIG